MAEDYISMFDRGESKDDMELSYHCSSPAYSEEEGEGGLLLLGEETKMTGPPDTARSAGRLYLPLYTYSIHVTKLQAKLNFIV